MSSSCCWKIFYLEHFYSLLLVPSAAFGRYFTLNILLIIAKILLIITRVVCCCWKIFYLEHFTHYYEDFTHYYVCHLLLLEDIFPRTFYSLLLLSSAAVGRSFTLKILLIITRVICRIGRIFYLELLLVLSFSLKNKLIGIKLYNSLSMHIAFNFCKHAMAAAFLNVRKMSCLAYLKKKMQET